MGLKPTDVFKGSKQKRVKLKTISIFMPWKIINLKLVIMEYNTYYEQLHVFVYKVGQNVLEEEEE